MDKEEFEIFEGFDKMMQEDEKRWTPPVCHFTPMFHNASDSEDWWECKHCGHTKHICSQSTGW